MSEVDVLHQISNLKEIDYKNTLAISALIDLLIEKKVITKTELLEKAKSLDNIAVTKN